jgi:predicted dehydrogenase
MTRPIDRRDFMRRATGAGALTLAIPRSGETSLANAQSGETSLSLAGPSTRNVLGANDRVRAGAIGSGRQALSNMKAFQKHGAEIVAVCDVYEPNLAKGKALAGETAATFKDFRSLLDDKTIDLVIVSTPDHWHALPMVMACQAGKDVFVEKPVSVAVEEGKAMLAAAREHQRVVQVALWQRSNAHFQQAVRIVRSGLLGKVTAVRAWNSSNESPARIGSPPDGEPPPGLDWDLWLGPAPKVRFNPNRFGVREDRWSTFRYFWDYSNGILGDWGVHLLDVVQWALEAPGPRAVSSVGQKLAVRDNGDAPDTQMATFEYADFLCTYEYRAANADAMRQRGHGISFHGTEATMLLSRHGFEVFPETREGPDDEDVARAPAMKMDRVDDGLENHAADKLACMRSRKRPACDIEDGLRSSAPCMLGVVALRTGERLEFDPVKQELRNASAAARKLFGREYRAPWKLG